MRDEICMYAQLSLQWASLTYFKTDFILSMLENIM